MRITIAIIGLWIGCSAISSSLCGYYSYRAGAGNVLRIAGQYLTGGELEGGKAFAIGAPALIFVVLGSGGIILSLSSLLISRCIYKEPLFSMCHLIALLFLAPLIPVLMIMA